ncbi:hypothetical protein ACP4OV_011054 [Aristida adscensionis]
MAAPSAHAGGAADRPRGAKHRRPLLSHLQLPAAASSSSNGWFGRPAGPSTAPAASSASGAHAARSPSLLRSPSAWIRAKGHSFGSSSGKHAAPSRPGNFHYDAGSYARNFDDGDGGDVDAFRLRCFSPRVVPTSPEGGAGAGGKGDGNQPHHETGR